jgi:hypothetical protein
MHRERPLALHWTRAVNDLFVFSMFFVVFQIRAAPKGLMVLLVLLLCAVSALDNGVGRTPALAFVSILS